VSAREALIDNSIEALRIRGYNALGVQEIADAAGMPKGSFYNHFESKEDFAVAAMEKYLAGAVEVSQRTLQDARHSAYERILRLYDARIRFERTRLKTAPGCLLSAMAQEMSGTSEKLRAASARGMRKMAALVAACIQEAEARSEIHPPVAAEKTAAYLDMAWRGALLFARAEKSIAPLQNFYKMIPVILGRKAE
jgi:TetR/AcrR family transcriptional regulator, transcriptional repressor for nem operon